MSRLEFWELGLERQPIFMANDHGTRIRPHNHDPMFISDWASANFAQFFHYQQPIKPQWPIRFFQGPRGWPPWPGHQEVISAYSRRVTKHAVLAPRLWPVTSREYPRGANRSLESHGSNCWNIGSLQIAEI